MSGIIVLDSKMSQGRNNQDDPQDQANNGICAEV